ncbi:1-phosphofructokinase [Alicyclobacillus sacchari]|uniref:Tagatose-6-phosphate kinase n=1 Tax=Alicyclobacillus sacchari TaxID=392010 RepID=A0A4R8LSF0_9BACL|nr:1-phosphofructokinase [Alicyclobacillus sacchari]TDY50579.1 1-phosphofructokinase [Alicyclobacillus sacchari]TDY50587.1 1-phosphofructokinase [Alicyclobacillus sacchari]GMA59139.1 sugar kinase [Alicyclobacillus sacchari]
MSDRTFTRVEPDVPVLTVTINPAIDVFIHVDSLAPGTLHRVSAPIQQVGGKGINVSRTLHALGQASMSLGFVGGARGEWLESQLATIATDFTHIRAQTRMNVKVIERDGHLTEFNSPAPAIEDGEWQLFRETLQRHLPHAKWLALCGNVPDTVDPAFYRDAIRLAAEYGVRCVLDASGEALRLGVTAKPFLVKPNLVELAELTGHEVIEPEDAMDGAMQLVRTGIALVVVSMGGDGLIAATAKEQWIARVPSVRVVSSVGAGDAVVAGLLYGLSQYSSLRDAVRFAAAVGTAKVTCEGTSNPSRDEIDHIFRDVEVAAWRG